jgi:hypothetical protein
MHLSNQTPALFSTQPRSLQPSAYLCVLAKTQISNCNAGYFTSFVISSSMIRQSGAKSEVSIASEAFRPPTARPIRCAVRRHYRLDRYLGYRASVDNSI